MSGRIVALRLALATVAGALAASPALACPPQIVVERATGASADSAFLLVHATPGCHPGTLTVTGTAEGLIGGARRSLSLDIAATHTEGVYRVRRQWPSEGVWVLRLVVRVGEESATALVGIDASGAVAAVRQQDPARRVYPTLTGADVERMLRALAR